MRETISRRWRPPPTKSGKSFSPCLIRRKRRETLQEQIDGRYAFLQRARTDAQLAYAYQNLTDAVRALSGIHMVTFSETAIRRYNALVAMRLNIGRMDLRIAAIALEEDAVVITLNLRDFGRVPGLTRENWAD